MRLWRPHSLANKTPPPCARPPRRPPPAAQQARVPDSGGGKIRPMPARNRALEPRARRERTRQAGKIDGQRLGGPVGQRIVERAVVPFQGVGIDRAGAVRVGNIDRVARGRVLPHGGAGDLQWVLREHPRDGRTAVQREREGAGVGLHRQGNRGEEGGEHPSIHARPFAIDKRDQATEDFPRRYCPSRPPNLENRRRFSES